MKDQDDHAMSAASETIIQIRRYVDGIGPQRRTAILCQNLLKRMARHIREDIANAAIAQQLDCAKKECILALRKEYEMRLLTDVGSYVEQQIDRFQEEIKWLQHQVESGEDRDRRRSRATHRDRDHDPRHHS